MATFTCYTLKLSKTGPLKLHFLMEYPTAVKLSKLHIYISVGRAHTHTHTKQVIERHEQYDIIC